MPESAYSETGNFVCVSIRQHVLGRVGGSGFASSVCTSETHYLNRIIDSMDDQQVPHAYAQSTEDSPPVQDDANNTSASSPSDGGGGSSGTGISYKPTCTEPHLNDVLCGRGGMTNQHVGNAHWRSLVAANKRLYLKLPKRQKMLVSESIVKAVRSQDPPGRFLKLDRQTKIWTDIGDRKAASKTSQALREGAPKLRGKMIAEETSSIASSLPYSESDAASVMSSSAASVTDLMAAGQNQAPQVVANGAVAKVAPAIFVEGDAASVAGAYMPAAALHTASAASAASSTGMAYMSPRTLAPTPQITNTNAAPVIGPGIAAASKIDDESDYSGTGGGGSTTASAHTPLAGNMLVEPQSLAQVIATPNVNPGVTAGALTEQQRVQQALTWQEQQAMMPPPPPRLPQQPQQAQPQNMQQPYPHPQTQIPVQEELQSPAQIQYQISQIALLLKQLEIQVQSQGMQITLEQQAQYAFLMQQQQTLAQMFFLAQQQEQLELQQLQMMQQSVGGNNIAPSTTPGGKEGSATGVDITTTALDEAKAMQPPLPVLNGQEQQLPRRPSGDMMRTENGRTQTQEEFSAPMVVGMAAAAASTNAHEQQKQNKMPTPRSKAQKRLSQEDLERWSRVKAMLAKTSSTGTGDTNAAHVSHPGSIHRQSSGAAAPLPAAASTAAAPAAPGGDEHDPITTNQSQTSLNRDVSMMSTFSGLSGIISVGEPGNFDLERGDTRGNGAVDMTDMVTRDISAAMSEMSLSRGPSLSMAGDIFGSVPNGGDSGLAPGSLTGLGDDDDNDEHEERFKSLRNTNGSDAAASKPPNKSSGPNNDGAGNGERNLTHEEQVQMEFLRRGTSLAGEVFGGRSA